MAQIILQRNNDGTFLKGFSYSPETQFKKGMKMPKSIIEKRTFSVIGKKRPRQSLLMKGRKFGPLSEEHKQKISLAKQKIRIIKNCQFCKKEFKILASNNRLFCSFNCFVKSKVGKIPKNFEYFHNLLRTKKWKENISLSLKGKKTPWTTGEKSYAWKGENVEYSTLHSWVRRWLGKPQECEICGKDGLTGRQIHWANINHQYKRNLTDWIRLCFKCHKKFDKELRKIYL